MKSVHLGAGLPGCVQPCAETLACEDASRETFQNRRVNWILNWLFPVDINLDDIGDLSSLTKKKKKKKKPFDLSELEDAVPVSNVLLLQVYDAKN